jgi:predicted  nucleic acid-binding Zn-ribbon protein
VTINGNLGGSSTSSTSTTDVST